MSNELDYFKDYVESTKQNKEYYKTVSAISVSDEKRSPSTKNSCIYNNYIYLLSIDDIVSKCTSKRIPSSRKKCEGCPKRKCKLTFHHTSTDALYVNFHDDYCHFFLLEFKKYNIKDKEEISGDEIRKLLEFQEFIKGTEFFDDYMTISEKAIKKLRDKEKDKIKLKAYETVNSIIPHMFIEYCIKLEKDYDISELKSFLLNCRFSFYLVYNYFGFEEEDHPNNKTRNRKHVNKSRKCTKDIFNIQRIRDFNFNDVDIIAGPKDFEETMKLIKSYNV